jgi:hypothetical protein
MNQKNESNWGFSLNYTSIFLFLLILICSCARKLTPTEAVQKLGASPYIEVDDIAKSQSEINSINPSDVASLTVYYDKEAIKLYGEKAMDGAVLVKTTSYAINQFETLFKGFSQEYEEMLRITERGEIQYILNERVLTSDFEGILARLSEKTLKRITIIDSLELDKKYQIKNKKIGVLVKAKRSKDLL